MDDNRIRPNFSELERQTGITRQTLTKKWEMSIQPFTHESEQRKSKYDAYKEQICEVFGRISNISAVFQYFTELNPDVFKSYEGFRYYVLSRGIVSKKADQKARPRFETDFGEQVQVDWKEKVKIITRMGEVIIFNLYVLVFSASRKRFFCIAFQETTEEFFRCTIETLRRAGGSPKSLLTDNMSAICNQRTGQLIKPVQEFLKDMGFNIRRCKVKTPQTKGKVESTNRFVQWLEAYQFEIEDVDDLYEKVKVIERQVNQKPNSTTGFAPDVLFPYDRKALQPLPRKEIMNGWINARDVVVNNTFLVNCRNGQYSVPIKLIGEKVTLVPSSNTLYIYKGLNVIRIHTLDPNGGMHQNPKDYEEGIAASMDNVSPDLIAEQARKNLEMIGAMERRKHELKNPGCGTGTTEG